MKSIQQLEQLAQNPFYKMSEEEAKFLKDSKKSGAKSPKAQEVNRPQDNTVRTSKSNAAVKETGKLNKHIGDPVKE